MNSKRSVYRNICDARVLGIFARLYQCNVIVGKVRTGVGRMGENHWCVLKASSSNVSITSAFARMFCYRSIHLWLRRCILGASHGGTFCYRSIHLWMRRYILGASHGGVSGPLRNIVSNGTGNLARAGIGCGDSQGYAMLC